MGDINRLPPSVVIPKFRIRRIKSIMKFPSIAHGSMVYQNFFKKATNRLS